MSGMSCWSSIVGHSLNTMLQFSDPAVPSHVSRTLASSAGLEAWDGGSPIVSLRSGTADPHSAAAVQLAGSSNGRGLVRVNLLSFRTDGYLIERRSRTFAICCKTTGSWHIDI